MSNSSLGKLISFRSSPVHSGQLVVFHQGVEVPFPILRIYYLTGVLPGANLKYRQVMIPISGSFSVTIDDGERKETFRLSSPAEGLFIPEKTWRTVHDFTSDAICLVICSEAYDPLDYIKDYGKFIQLRTK
jgi:hypothetical protein